MCRTKTKIWAVIGGAAMAVTVSAGAQTIGELAEAQRAKLKAEIAQRNAVADPAAAKAADQAVKPVVARDAGTANAARVEAPSLRVHSLYQRSGTWLAEVTDGRRLAMPVPGMKYGRYSLQSIDEKGLHLVRLKDCAKRDKSCQNQRVVGVGGEL